ncbi:dipeptidase (plasmid) [Cytobacillus spongiae]|uniref:dipeptidase n=1 Tax=Cytobacillus spongiae TaxID=2901381 RepID=UPI00145E4263|nr:dipeptidase [Cytobacillus spongiae]MCA1062449.1 dipeptidase [Rossellomorea aquimaris]NMH71108.1 membrane dipeptidase [Bacillus sp. RO3]UII58044.1 dipeptidase [Cytobacillus spongiae]
MIFDAHCDVLMKLYLKPGQAAFQSQHSLHITYPMLIEKRSRVQLFAIYIPSHLKAGQRFQAALEMVNLFHNEILKPNPKLRHVTSKHEVDRLAHDEIGAMLTLEGTEAIEEDLTKLEILYRLGVRSVGLTWNWANAAADGALEPRGGGLTHFGHEVVSFLNQNKVWTDVSHLSEKAFWDTMECAEYPIASHSNAYSICPHPRNLKNDQIQAMIKKDSVMGITFVPPFLNKKGHAVVTDVIRHVEHVCSLGGENHIGFGSDFDGISETVQGLSSFHQYDNLINALQRYYSESQVKKFLFNNFAERLTG